MTNETTPTPGPNADVEASHGLTEHERAELAEPESTEVEETAEATETKAAAVEAPADPAPAVEDPLPESEPTVEATSPPAPSLLAVPEAPKDFEKAFDDLDAKFEADDLSDADYRREMRKLSSEQASYEARRAAAEATNEARIGEHQANVQQSFTAAQDAWVAANSAFMANPLRAKAMQEALNVVDTETGGKLAPAALLDRAQKIAFEAYSWAPKAAVEPGPNATAQALAARQQAAEPPKTLGSAPTAGSDNGTSKYGNLDDLPINELEARVAHMSDSERESWLREVDAELI